MAACERARLSGVTPHLEIEAGDVIAPDSRSFCSRSGYFSLPSSRRPVDSSAFAAVGDTLSQVGAWLRGGCRLQAGKL